LGEFLLRAAREAVGPDFSLMPDNVAKYNFTQALEVGRALAELNYHWFEEPIPDRNIAVLRRLADELTSLGELPEYLTQHAGMCSSRPV